MPGPERWRTMPVKDEVSGNFVKAHSDTDVQFAGVFRVVLALAAQGASGGVWQSVWWSVVIRSTSFTVRCEHFGSVLEIDVYEASTTIFDHPTKDHWHQFLNV